MVNLVQGNDDYIQHQLEMFWKTDFGDSLVDKKKSISVEDSQALKTMERTATKVKVHYHVALPWRSSSPKFSQ